MEEMSLTHSDFEELQVPDTLSPEQRMYLAVIERTLFDYLKTNAYHRLDRRDAERFLFSDSKKDYSLFWYGTVLSNRPEEFVIKIRQFAKRLKDSGKYAHKTKSPLYLHELP